MQWHKRISANWNPLRDAKSNCDSYDTYPTAGTITQAIDGMASQDECLCQWAVGLSRPDSRAAFP